MKKLYTVMGVSGSGKSTTGRALADRLGWPFHEGDDYHPKANIEKMSAGTPLTNDDRKPWIAIMTEALNAAPEPCHILACSALSGAVRGWLEDGFDGDVTFVYLKTDEQALRHRLETRPGHFFKGSMLDSQLAALEEPEDGGNVVVVDAGKTVDDLVGEIAGRI
ncbi:gluconokinase [Aquisalinus flavus]|uniref:Gluconokinase n=1 Tax=Aquisalinus flavus TaxID=1526572 RepID=A0A8J2V2A8_9PROT|nr:gluconokinase [Aquisalinus flavus]MBD0425251.1 gluconokinase [Aquisalinus flavus]UNE49092.1 gluconokinase [Aquisalinus flavus]GGD17548.1 gluconokinase [Aquisalinus flavus]